MADILAFLGFLVITNSGVNVEGALGHVSIHFDDSHSLQFAVVVAVAVWVWTLVLITALVLVQLMDAWSPSPLVIRIMSRTNAVACLFSYSAAVVTSAVSSNCNTGTASTFYLYSDDTVKSDVATFCNQIKAGTTFLWFTFIAFAGAVVLKAYTDSVEAQRQRDTMQGLIGGGGGGGGYSNVGGDGEPPPFKASPYAAGLYDESAGSFVGHSAYEADRGFPVRGQAPILSTADL
jgi:hypothetical protein